MGIYNVAYYMNIGLKNDQEDCIFINGRIVQQDDSILHTQIEKIDGSHVLFALCDGIGGHAKGEQASRFVCERLLENFDHFSLSKSSIKSLLGKIQSLIEQEAPEYSGTTVAGTTIKGTRAIIFNAGDSRVYKITRRSILYISHDHSLVQSYIDKGYLTQDEAFKHPNKNVIDFGIGAMFKKAWDNGSKKVYIKNDTLKRAEYYLLCTDGVNDILRDEEIFRILYPDPFSRLYDFIDCLKERMRDNFSFIIIGHG
jgi:serine/threonine protein phosphatase PrpC